jgi:hypothetical protein
MNTDNLDFQASISILGEKRYINLSWPVSSVSAASQKNSTVSLRRRLCYCPIKSLLLSRFLICSHHHTQLVRDSASLYLTAPAPARSNGLYALEHQTAFSLPVYLISLYHLRYFVCTLVT